jgi:hypothetical protein
MLAIIRFILLMPVNAFLQKKDCKSANGKETPLAMKMWDGMGCAYKFSLEIIVSQ